MQVSGVPTIHEPFILRSRGHASGWRGLADAGAVPVRAPGAGAIIFAPMASLICRGPAGVALQPAGADAADAAIGEMPMPAPVTTFDERYSDPAAVALLDLGRRVCLT